MANIMHRIRVNTIFLFEIQQCLWDLYQHSWFVHGDVFATEKVVSVTFFAGYVQLFYHPDNTQTAFTFRPDIMEPEEIETFPELVR